MLKTAALFIALATLGCVSTGAAKEAPKGSESSAPVAVDLPPDVVIDSKMKVDEEFGNLRELKKSPPSKKGTPKVSLREVELKYSKAKSFKANVTKTLKLKMLERETKLEGTLELKKPSRFRLEFSKPEPSLVITNGKTLWMVTPPADPDFDNTTRVIRTSNLEKIQAQALIAFLLGKGRLSSEFKVEKETHEEGRAKFQLTPKEKGDVERVEIMAQDATQEILEIRYWDKLENETTLVLTDGQFNKPIANTQFTYTPPKGAQVEDL